MQVLHQAMYRNSESKLGEDYEPDALSCLRGIQSESISSVNEAGKVNKPAYVRQHEQLTDDEEKLLRLENLGQVVQR